MLTEAEVLAMEGEYDAAIAVVEKLSKISSPGDSMQYMIRASVYTNKVFAELQTMQGNPLVMANAQGTLAVSLAHAT